jgi:hypothetical protein
MEGFPFGGGEGGQGTLGGEAGGEEAFGGQMLPRPTSLD